MVSAAGPAQGPLLLHAALVGVTPLVPVPLLDDAAKEYLMRRMVRALAASRGLALAEDEIAVLADDPGGKWVGEAAKTVLLLPLKIVFRTTFMVLSGKKMVDLASEAYHRGFLYDHVFESGWCAPRGLRTGAEVRAAVDAVCLEVNTSPVERALSAGFQRSRGLVDDAARLYRQALGGAPTSAPEGAGAAVETVADKDAAGLADIVAQLRRAMSEVPDEHFDELRRRVRQKLG